MASINVSSSAALSTALTAARAGDTVLLSPGIYTLNASGLKFATDITVASTDVGKPAVITSLTISNCAGITLRDLDLTALSTGGDNPFKIYYSQDIHLERLNVHGSLDGNPQNDVGGFLIRDSRDVSITDSEFQELSTAIAHLNSFGVTVARNEFHHLVFDGVRGGGSSSVTISGNLFRDFFPRTGDHPDAIQFWTTNTTTSARDLVITDNAFIRGGGGAAQGIFLRDQVGTLPYENVTITGNVMAGSMYQGISVSHATNVTVNDNIVQGFTGMSSWIRLVKVDGVTVTNNSANEVMLPESTRVTVANNTILPPATDQGAWAFARWSPPSNTASDGAIQTGGPGADTLTGGAGADTLGGAGGLDVLTGGGGDDVYLATMVTKVVELAGGGLDTVRSGEAYYLPANVENLELSGARSVSASGNALNNIVLGNAGGNYMGGGEGNDTLDGRGGNDVISGGVGDDRLIGGAGSDTFVFKVGGGADTVADFSAGDILDVSAILTSGGRASLASGAMGVTILFTTGESITLTGATLDHLVSTPTGWVFG